MLGKFKKRYSAPPATRLGGAAKILICFLVLAVVHFAFRYIFQISDSGTSPGYQNTPPLLSSIKDWLLLALLLSMIISALFLGQFKVSRLGIAAFLVFVLMSAFACLRIILGVSVFDVLLSIRTLWLPSLLVLVVDLIPRHQAGIVLCRVAQILIPILLTFQAVTVVLYLVIHRLPALSYVGNPRFGGILDDPNGYGALCVLLMAVQWGRTKWVWLAALAINVLMTVSLSAYAVLAMYLFLQFVRQIRSKRLRTHLGWASFGILTLASGAYIWSQFSTQIVLWWVLKTPSIQAHSSSASRGIDSISQSSLAQLALGNLGFSENQWLLTILNYGVIGLVLQVFLVVWLLFRCLNKNSSVGAWGVAVVIASALIPYLYVYPISVFLWAMLALGARQTTRMSTRAFPSNVPSQALNDHRLKPEGLKV